MGTMMLWHMRLLKGLASLRLTVGLLFWLAFMCILGTIIPQVTFQPSSGASVMTDISRPLSLNDVFHSFWFLIPTVVLGLNAAACMYRRRKSFAGSVKPPAMPKAGLYGVTIPKENKQDKIGAELAGLIKATHSIVRNESGGGLTIMGEKGRLRMYAPLLVHGSILMILLGVAFGFLGYKGSIEIPVGQATDNVVLSDGTIMHLPFQVRCEDFKVEYYDNGMPREYRSEVSFSQAGGDIARASVMVNHPVSFNHVLFSQSGYNPNLIAAIRVGTPSGSEEIKATEGSVIEMHDTGYRMKVVRVVEDVMHLGPAVQLIIETPNDQKEVWVFKEFKRIQAIHPGITEEMPEFNPSLLKPYTFTLDALTSSYTTILGINSDPGVPLVGLGAILFLFGVIIAFMVVHERIFFEIGEGSDGLMIHVARRLNGRPAEIDGRILKHLERLAGGQL
jgi:cytochrome c biogenesis protein